jgi:hypothetical protein
MVDHAGEIRLYTPGGIEPNTRRNSGGAARNNIFYPFFIVNHAHAVRANAILTTIMRGILVFQNIFYNLGDELLAVHFHKGMLLRKKENTLLRRFGGGCCVLEWMSFSSVS